MSKLPFMIELAGKRVVVVGAGAVGTRRIRQLLDADAAVHVVAPDCSADVAKWADAGVITVDERAYREGDVAGAWLAVTATGVSDVDQAVTESAERDRIWCINSALHSQSTATPMLPIEGPDGVQIAVHGGGDPGRAIALRNAIELALKVGDLPIRATRTTSSSGRVTLLGAGPGDPSLLTVRAAQALAMADVLVVDRLAPAASWEHAPADVLTIDVGKQPGKHAVSQTEINDILVAEANKGQHVVRLKGGDPFVLGRGGEEAQACIEAGVPVEVIPGITSAIAVPGAAGIPVTHRGVTSTFIVASAHEGPEGVLAAVSDAPHTSTLILLMGAGKLPSISAALIASGRSPETPVAIIESGLTVNQHTTITSLGEAEAGTVRVKPPAVVVIGEVVRLRAELGDLAIASPEARHA
ncbi:MAG: uroporphyrinogen-III C-methyltransferase [Candidatus Nanopelagicales bacterium]